MGIAWGTFPDWVGAVGTAGALMAAVSVLALDLKRRQEEHLATEKAQARLVAGWLLGVGHEAQTPNGTVWTYAARYVNRSDLPVYDCLLRLEWPGQAGAHHLIKGVLAPGEEGTEDV